MRNTVRFRFSKFNSSEPREYFINPGCFGDDLAAWLRPRLEARGYRVTEPDQEDWSWYLECTGNDGGHTLNIALVEGEEVWQIYVERHRTLADRLLGKNAAPDQSFLAALQAVLVTEEIFEVEWVAVDGRGREMDSSSLP